MTKLRCMRVALIAVAPGLFYTVSGCGPKPHDADVPYAALLRSFAGQPGLELAIGSGTPPELKAPGPGSGPWNSERPSFENRLLAGFLPDFLRTSVAREQWGKEAADSFSHYFDNNGTDFTIEPSRLFGEVPKAAAIHAEARRSVLALMELMRADLKAGDYRFASLAAGASVVSKAESNNWYLAVAAYSWFVTGEATVTESGDVHGSWSWHLWDRYDWDPGVSVPVDTPLGTIRIDQDRVAQFHRQGLAREFTTVGSITETF